MKDGDAFLLDEISLAEDSVLERLNSVLETGRSILLAEKGDGELVLAHPDFRFCATMNPGGDFGKKELSPALRNRFTEIWVPALSATKDMTEIVQSKLTKERRHFAQIMVSFAAYMVNRRSGPLDRTTISIRDLLAWCEFCNIPTYTPDQALVQGAALLFRDLDADALAELANLSGIANLADLLVVGDVRLENGIFAIGNFAIPSSAAQLDSSFDLSATTTRSNASRVLRAMQLRKPILLEGSPGVGKTSLVTAIARAAGQSLVRINFSEQTDLMDLFGSDMPVDSEADSISFAWRPAAFLRAMQSGAWVLLDEMNLATQSILEGLNACLDHRGEAFIPELNRAFDCHPNFRVFAAQNPHSQGGGRKGLPKSFVNRFTVVYCDELSLEDELQICRNVSKHKDVDRVLQFAMNVRSKITQDTAFASVGAPWDFNLRDALRWVQLLETFPNAPAAYFGDMLIKQRLRTSEDKAVLQALLDSHFEPFTRHACAAITRNELRIDRAYLPRACAGAVPSGIAIAHVGMAESIMFSVQLAWPVLLAGPSASGKSTLIRSLAGLLGRNLVEISMNQDMDSSDLLGSFEQTDFTRRYHRHIQDLRDLIRPDARLEHTGLMERLATRSDEPETLQLIRRLAPQLSSKIDAAEALLPQLAQQSRGSFEWVEGALVRAVKTGSWLVLDNANRCPASVLDRLNSLLEPAGRLTINERVDGDGNPLVIEPHPAFRLFLTSNPVNGELSRAMRNRCVELWIDRPESFDSIFESAQAEESNDFGLWRAGPSYALIPALTSRHSLRHFRTEQWDDVDHVRRVCGTNVNFFDRLQVYRASKVTLDKTLQKFTGKAARGIVERLRQAMTNPTPAVAQLLLFADRILPLDGRIEVLAAFANAFDRALHKDDPERPGARQVELWQALRGLHPPTQAAFEHHTTLRHYLHAIEQMSSHTEAAALAVNALRILNRLCEVTCDDIRIPSVNLSHPMRSNTDRDPLADRLLLAAELRLLSKKSAESDHESLTSIAILARRPLETLAPFFAPLSTVANILAASGNAVELSLAIPSLQGTMASWLAQRYTRDNVALDEYDVADARRRTIDGEMARSLASLSIRPAAVVGRVANLILPGLDLIEFAVEFVRAYLPVTPTDPAAEIEIQSKMRSWSIAQLNELLSAARHAHKCIHGRPDSPFIDRLTQEISHAQAVMVTVAHVVRPVQSQLLELHAEFEYVRQLLHMEALDSPARSTAIRGNLLRVRQRLRSFTMYQDLVAPLLAVLAILELALLERERSQERDKLESSPTFPVSPLTLVSIGPERYDAPAGELDLLRQSQFALEWIKFTRSSSSPEQLVHDLSAKWFQAFFIARELEAKRSAEQGSLYKGFEEEMDEEAAIKELFPDYEAESSHPSQSSGLDTLRLDAFQQLASFWSGTAEPSSLTELIRLATKAALESRATLGEDPQLLHAAAVHLATKAGSVTAYDFYRDPDKPKALLLRGLLLPLRYRVTELRDEWPENAVLDDLLDSINALLAMSVASPIAQLLTMAEQVFVKVAGWQETAARHVSLVTHFEAIRNLVVSWRRYELGCWPQLLDVEDRRALEADTKAYYHLFELLVFAPLRHSENDYVTMALGLLFEFMRKSTLAQFPRRCLYIQGFAKHLTWLSASGKISTTWAEAVCHVSRYFSRSTQPVMATLAAEKKIFSKEVYQTMKLASWKDTNVYALRESARRSHRTLYKVIRKYRSLLARPVLPELEKEFAFQRSARFVASMPEVLPMPAVGLPDRYQHPSRTIARLARISAVERPENAIAGLLSDATMTARELRNATPKEATEEALKQIKHLKTRKRKLLADSLRELRRLGLRTSTQPAVAAAQADQISVIRNTRCLASVDGTFDQVIQILPKVREVLFSHSEDLTINEIRRATGLFDALLDRSRRNLALLADAFEMLEQLRKSAARFCQLSQLDSWSPVAPTQLREVSSYVQSVTRYLCFLPVSIGGMASVGELRYEEPATWRSILADFERIQSVLVPELAVLDPQTADTISGLPEVISHTRGAVSDIQSACPELAPMYDELLVLLSQCPAPEVRGVSSQPVREELLLDMADGFLVAAQKLDGLDWSEVSTLEGDWHDRYHKVASERIACLLRPSLIRKASRIADDLSSTSCTSTNVLQHIAPVIAAYAAVAAREVDTFCAIHEETLKNTYSVARTLVSLGQEGFCGPSEGEATSSSAANAQASDGTGLGDGQGQKDVSETLDDDEEIDLADAQPPEAGQDNSENDDRQDAREQADDFVGDLEDVPQSDEDSVESDGQEDATDDLDEEIGEVDDLDPSALDEKMWDGEQEELREKETDKQNARGESDLVDKATDDGDDEPSADSADDADADDEQASMADDTDPPPSDQNGVEQDKELPPPAQNLDLPDDIKMDDEIETEDAGDVEETVDVDEPEDVNTPMEDPKNDATENESETGEEAEATTPQDSSITAPESLEDEQEDAKMQDADSAAGDGQDFQEDDAVDAAEHGAKAGAPTERQADMLDDPQHDEHPSSTNEGALQSLASHHDAEMSASRELMKQEESVRTLGDALEHYRRLLHIAEAQSQSEQQGEVSQDGTSAEVEHVGEEENHQSQALGPSENTEIPPIPQMEAEEKETREHGEAGGGGGDAAPSDARDIELMPIDEVADQLDNQSDENGSNRQEAGLEATGEIIRGPEAVSDWRRHIDATRSLSHALSEQLRLVLEPTLATKLQGDYRTGKRLNMRRIIPYVASQFKKDKIWLRRTKPSKRQYQVMLSVDDSHSMADCGATELAYQSISLISSALSTLESGEFALVGFGEQPRILHRFEDAFQVSDKLFDGLTFSQGRTNIRALMDDSLKLFRHARQRSEAALDLWQLQLILSDGLCEDHEGIRTVLRQMHEERILVVFVVLDSRKDSILKMRQVKYDQGMTIRSYMESFPFEQRILIRDLSELPALLCSILRQFFSET
ncbi:AAA ATPase midasin [Savitreella phatthalungensis]